MSQTASSPATNSPATNNPATDNQATAPRAGDPAATPLHKLGVSAQDHRARLEHGGWPWTSLGRVNRAIGGYCTGALVAPHWVQNGPEVSVSFSITWHTDHSLKMVKLSYVNAALRKFGFPQASAGTHPALDAVKVAAYDIARPIYDAVKKLVGDRRKAVALVFGRKAAAIS